MTGDRESNEYWAKRRKNNEAARRSREKRKMNDVLLERRVMQLTEENKKLRAQLQAIRIKYGELNDVCPSLTNIPDWDQTPRHFTSKVFTNASGDTSATVHVNKQTGSTCEEDKGVDFFHLNSFTQLTVEKFVNFMKQDNDAFSNCKLADHVLPVDATDLHRTVYENLALSTETIIPKCNMDSKDNADHPSDKNVKEPPERTECDILKSLAINGHDFGHCWTSEDMRKKNMIQPLGGSTVQFVAELRRQNFPSERPHVLHVIPMLENQSKSKVTKLNDCKESVLYSTKKCDWSSLDQQSPNKYIIADISSKKMNPYSVRLPHKLRLKKCGKYSKQ